MDRCESLIYNTNIRVRRVFLSDVLEQIAAICGFTEEERRLFAFSALLASALATEIKDDDGSVFVSLKAPYGGTVATAFCETDGRLRGYADKKEPDPLTDGNCLLTVGRRLYVRGDYQSSVMGETPEKAAEAYFINSAQTKAALKIEYGKDSTFYLCEYLPGHDVNTSEQKEAELKDKKAMLEKALEVSLNGAEQVAEMSPQSTTPITYGCTCSKRKLRAIFDSQGITIEEGMEAVCRLCGKVYTY